MLLGSYKVFTWGYRFANMLKRRFIRPLLLPDNHVFERYGCKDSWAVITGGSDGLGLA